MNPTRGTIASRVQSSILLGGAIMTLALQTVALAGLAWKGSAWATRIEDNQTVTVRELNRITSQLDALERRVHDLEVRRP